MLKMTMDAKMRPKMNNVIERLKVELAKANAEFIEISTEEEEGGYSDAMLSMDRTRAEGYAEGLEYALNLLLGGE